MGNRLNRRLCNLIKNINRMTSSMKIASTMEMNQVMVRSIHHPYQRKLRKKRNLLRWIKTKRYKKMTNKTTQKLKKKNWKNVIFVLTSIKLQIPTSFVIMLLVDIVWKSSLSMLPKMKHYGHSNAVKNQSILVLPQRFSVKNIWQNSMKKDFKKML